MIPRSSKFPMRTDFVRFRSRAKRESSPHFVLYHLLSSNISHLSVVVPAKVSKFATTRNWLRRLTYNTLWPLIQDKNLDCVVIYKPLVLTKSPATRDLIISELKSLAISH